MSPTDAAYDAAARELVRSPNGTDYFDKLPFGVRQGAVDHAKKIVNTFLTELVKEIC